MAKTHHKKDSKSWLITLKSKDCSCWDYCPDLRVSLLWSFFDVTMTLKYNMDYLDDEIECSLRFADLSPWMPHRRRSRRAFAFDPHEDTFKYLLPLFFPAGIGHR